MTPTKSWLKTLTVSELRAAFGRRATQGRKDTDVTVMSTDGNENDDPTALALLEELECGMCAGVFIEVGDV